MLEDVQSTMSGIDITTHVQDFHTHAESDKGMITGLERVYQPIDLEYAQLELTGTMFNKDVLLLQEFVDLVNSGGEDTVKEHEDIVGLTRTILHREELVFEE